MKSDSNLLNSLRLFLDVEFTDFVNIDLISIGLVSEQGHEFYGERTDFKHELCSPFVREHVLSQCDPFTYGNCTVDLSAKLWKWLTDLPAAHLIITIDYAGDYTLMHQLLGDYHPKISDIQNVYSSIYTAAALAAAGGVTVDGVGLATKAKNLLFFETLNYFSETNQKQHHALSDAKAFAKGYKELKKLLSVPS